MYRFLLNGIEIEDPMGYEDLQTVIEYDQSKKIITCKSNNTLTFYGGGYEIIKSNYVDNGVCVKLPIQVFEDCSGKGNFKKIIEGTVFLTDIVFDVCKCQAKAKIVDNNISSWIENNLDVKVNTNATKTKTSEVDNLNQVPECIIELSMIDGLTGTSNPVSRDVVFYDIREVLNQIVEFISDENLSFKSSFLNELDYCIGLTTTSKLKPSQNNDGTLNLELSASGDSFFCLGDIVDTLSKMFNLVMFADGDQVCLESVNYLESRQPILQIDCVDDLEISTDASKLYSNVQIGNNNEENENNQVNVNLVKGECVQHRKETFTISTQCNTRARLDLTYDCITSHNTIRSIFFGNESFEDQPIFIQFDCDTKEPIYDDPFNTFIPTEGYVVNPAFYNCNLLANYSFVGDLYKTNLTASNPFFKAISSGNLFTQSYITPNNNPITQMLQFQDDHTVGFDNDNNYGNGTVQGDNVSQANSVYCIPSDGVYTFCVQLKGTVQYGCFSGTKPFCGQGSFGTGPQVVAIDDPSLGTVFNPVIRIFPNVDGSTELNDIFSQSPFPTNVNTTTGAPIDAGYLDEACYELLYLQPNTSIDAPPQSPVWGIDDTPCPFVINATLTRAFSAGQKIGFDLSYDTFEHPSNELQNRALEMNFNITENTFWLKSANTGSEGGVIQEGDPNQNISIIKTERCLSQEQIQEVLDNKYNAVLVKSGCAPNMLAYINKMQINHTSKKVSFELRTNVNKL